MEKYYTVIIIATVYCVLILFGGLLAWLEYLKLSKPIEHGYGKIFSLNKIRNEVSDFVRTQFDLDYLPYVKIVYSRLKDDGIIAVFESDVCGKIEYNNGKITFLKDGQ